MAVQELAGHPPAAWLPGVLQSMMDSTFQGLVDDDGKTFFYVFVDDCHISSLTWEAHLRHLEIFLERAQARKLQFGATKCVFGHASTELLGFEISAEGKRPHPKKVAQLKNWPDPQSVDALVSFRAFANYLREFIPEFHVLVDKFKKYLKKLLKISAIRDLAPTLFLMSLKRLKKTLVKLIS